MAVISGKGGRVEGKSTIQDWSISHTADIQALIASNTKGAPIRLIGNKDWSGSYNAYGHTPEVFPGDLFQFAGSIDGTTGVDSGASGCIVNSVEIKWDVEAGTPITHTVTFSGNADLIIGADVVAADTTDPTMFTSIGTKLNIVNNTASSNADLADLRTMTLTITADNQSYVSSDTSGSTKRVAGNLDFTFTASVYASDFSTLPQVNDLTRSLKLYVNATEFWLLEYVVFGELSDMSVERESGANVSATINASMSGFSLISDVWTEGKIVTPASVTKWP